MANVQHKDIVDPNIHEPKGVAYATAGTAYVADGNGSGDWIEVVTPSLIGTVASAEYSVDETRTAKINQNNFVPLSFSGPTNTWGSTYLNVSSGFIECTKTGIYLLSIRWGFSYYTTTDVPQRYIWTKLRGSNTPWNSVFLPYLEANAKNTWVYQGLGSPITCCARIETGQGLGLWTLKDSDDVIFDINLQITRLSDG